MEFIRKIIGKIKAGLIEHRHSLILLALLFAFLFIYLWNNIVITIKAGEKGVLFKRFFGGTVVDEVYPEGLILIFPWDILQIYNVRVQQASRELYVLTKNGLRVDLTVSIRYYPHHKLLGILHQRVGPDYVNAIVVPEVEQVLRIVIGRLNAEEVYTTQRSVIERSVNNAVEQAAGRFVTIDDVLIKRLSLPDAVEEAIQGKIRQKHFADEYRYRLVREEREAKRKVIEADGLKQYNDIVGSSLSREVLQWLGIRATLQLSESDNSKVVVIGSGESGLPIIGNIPMEQGVPDFMGALGGSDDVLAKREADPSDNLDMDPASPALKGPDAPDAFKTVDAEETVFDERTENKR